MISVVIPVYNRENLLPLTLRSLLQQSLPAGEIIVVDDGSTDSTVDVAESFGAPVRVIRQENAGPAAARNRGFNESRGDFIHFFDSDDIALPNKHEIQLKALEDGGADIAFGPWVKGRFSEGGFEAENLILQQNGLPAGDLVKALLSNWSVVPHACLFKRSIVEKVGGFPEELFGTEDQMMFLNCLLAGAKVVHSPGTLELYRSDNTGKITDSSLDEGRRRHLINWARFLVLAEATCRSKGVDARKWFGFRCRISELLRDFGQFHIEEAEIENQLQVILDGTVCHWKYQLSREFERKRQGFEARLGRGRAHSCFRVGPMDEEQRIAMKVWITQESEYERSGRL
jgi:glycosyltransferase involved in cell wall biosynthesis